MVPEVLVVAKITGNLGAEVQQITVATLVKVASALAVALVMAAAPWLALVVSSAAVVLAKPRLVRQLVLLVASALAVALALAPRVLVDAVATDSLFSAIRI